MATISAIDRRHPGLHTPHERPYPPEAVNVGDVERWASVASGTALALLGLKQGSLGGYALAALGGCLVYRGASGHCSMYESLGVSTAPPRGEVTSVPAGAGVKVEKSVTVNRPASELFRFWRNVENLPRIMSHLKEVKDLGGGRSHWVARGPMGVSVEWDAEVWTERPDEVISWRSLPGSEVDNAGSVHFRSAPAGGGSEIRVVLKYDPPAGKVGAAVARLFGEEPEQQISDDLNKFKQMMESGGGDSRAARPTMAGRT